MTPSGIYKRSPSKAGQEQPSMIGQRFGRLFVISYDKEMSKLKGRDCYLCCCNCGNKRVISGNDLRSKRSQSCGCLNREMTTKHLVEFNKTRDQTGENNSGYLDGFYAERDKFKKIIRKRDKICQRCGKTNEEELTNINRRLSVHHLDGDEYNNDSKNGALLCHKCHVIVTRNNNTWRPNHEQLDVDEKTTASEMERTIRLI